MSRFTSWARDGVAIVAMIRLRVPERHPHANA
jgi:hypothetical protein